MARYYVSSKKIFMHEVNDLIGKESTSPEKVYRKFTGTYNEFMDKHGGLNSTIWRYCVDSDEYTIGDLQKLDSSNSLRNTRRYDFYYVPYSIYDDMIINRLATLEDFRPAKIYI